MTPKFNIGDWVYCAGWKANEAKVPCPDCGGTGKLAVTLFDGETLSVDCRNCTRGWMGPQGRIAYYDLIPDVCTGTVMTISIGEGSIEYGVTATYFGIYDQSRVFGSHEEAMAEATRLAHEKTEENRKRALESKERDGSSWAWEVNYHRKRIRDCEQDIERSRAKLGYAKQQAAVERKQRKTKEGNV